MSVIPCKQNQDLREEIERFAEILRTQAHTLGNHGLSEREFYESGLFRGAIERIGGQFKAKMGPKREFVQHVLNHMQDRNFIDDWEFAGAKNRHDYVVQLKSGKTAVIELKGCLDGNNSTIFERPPNAEEFLVWGVCTNQGSDPRRNAWSGIHTRLGAEIISMEKQVDGLVIWDMVCGTIGRPCPKADYNNMRMREVGPFFLPPPCIYVFPGTIPSPRNNASPSSQKIEDVELLSAFVSCFGGHDDEISYVEYEVSHHGVDTVRITRILRNGETIRESKPTTIKRK